VLDGSWKAGNVWGGVKDGMVKVGAFGPKVPKAVQDEVLQAQQDIASGRLAPFAARQVVVRDNEGRTVIAVGQALNDGQILGMDWLAEGVQGKLPR
jgi:simple sugar transport system substrate-binding protein